MEQILGKYRVACRACNIVNVKMVTLRPVPNESGNFFFFLSILEGL